MKVALLGDVHVGARNDSPAFHDLFAKFYNKVFFPYLEEHNILHVVQLGDMFDRRKYINFTSLKSSREYLFDRLNKEYTTWVLVGNHDTYYKNTNDVNSLDLLLDGYNQIHIVNEPTYVDFEETTFLLLPWINEQNQQQCYDAIKATTANVIAGHFEIDGFEMHRGAAHQGGMSPSVFDGHELVVSGHFHHRSHKGSIHYLGTPYEITWSDHADQKGFHVYDTETREMTFVPNPYSMFHKVHYDDKDKQMEEVIGLDFDQYRDTYVKLIVHTKSNPYWFDVFIDKLEKAGVHGVQVVDDHKHADVVDDSEIIGGTDDTLHLLTQHVKQLDHNVDGRQLEKVMVSLYNDALNLE